VEIPHTRQPLKIRSLQCFKQPVQAITAGDRAGICVSPAPNSKLERSYVAALGLMQSTSTVVCAVRKCRFYSGVVSGNHCL
jgi:selenocysteine-specific translation elongation factor